MALEIALITTGTESEYASYYTLFNEENTVMTAKMKFLALSMKVNGRNDGGNSTIRRNPSVHLGRNCAAMPFQGKHTPSVRGGMCIREPKMYRVPLHV